MRLHRFSTGFALAAILIIGLVVVLFACGDENSDPKNDQEKLVLAEQMIDRYIAGWRDRDVEALLALYDEGATIILPSRGTFNPSDLRTYLENLFASLDKLETQETDRDVTLTASKAATIKFRHWLFTRGIDGQFFAEKTWIKMQMSFSYSKNWRIVYQNGEDQFILNDQIGFLLSEWLDAWKIKNVDGIVAAYDPLATIVEADGEAMTPEAYRAKLNTLFTGLQTVDVNFSDYTLQDLDWETARLFFRLRTMATDLEGHSSTTFVDLTWEMKIRDNDAGWLVSKQTAANETTDDDDDDSADDDDNDNDASPADDDDNDNNDDNNDASPKTTG